MTMTMLRRSFVPSRCIFDTMLRIYISLLLPWLFYAQEPTNNRLHHYTDSFPTNDEYDMTILDPNTVYGSPYGGFSRNTPSRLASLPLHLPEDLYEDSRDWELDEAYVITDAQGRLFTCKTYSEDELDPSSLQESMFTAPRFKEKPDEVKSVNNIIGGDDKAGMSSDSDVTSSDKSTCNADDGTCSSSDTSRDSKPAENSDQQQQQQTLVSPTATGQTSPQSNTNTQASDVDKVADTMTTTTSDNRNPWGKIQFGAFKADPVVPNDPSTFTVVIEADKALQKLKGVCAQIHLGWWSYEWCHEERVTQFHIAVKPGANPNQPLLQRLELQDITSLGKKTSHRVTPNPPDDVRLAGRRKNWQWSEMRNGLKEIAMVQDIFTEGDICPDTGKPRESIVKYRCCSSKQMATFKNSMLVQGDQKHAMLAAFVALNEDPDNVCHYEAIICTPLLCRGDVEPEEPRFTTGIRNEVQGGMIYRAKPRKDGESIRETLERVLTNVCLQHSDGGWWIYEICHGKHVRQFHEANVIDRVTGMQSRAIETQHHLGYYDSEALDGFPSADEHKHVVNSTDSRAATAHRGNGAYFTQEYTRGDVCDHSDVTDAAIKAGEVSAGGVQRSTTVRWFCGKKVELAQATEDSTCHYLIDVTLPDLCENPLFMAPVTKQKVVKCLPVKEPELRTLSYQ